MKQGSRNRGNQYPLYNRTDRAEAAIKKHLPTKLFMTVKTKRLDESYPLLVVKPPCCITMSGHRYTPNPIQREKCRKHVETDDFHQPTQHPLRKRIVKERKTSQIRCSKT